MKQLTCEMCGSTDLMKQDGVFVCQTCGTKYSVEEAKKMMVEGTVEITGTVKVDDSEVNDNYLGNARRAYEAEDWENAEKYYGLVTQTSQNDLEVAFFRIYCRARKQLCSTQFIEREQTFKIILNIIPTINKIYHNTDENQNMLQEIGKALNKMYTSNFVDNEKGTGSYTWQINKFNEVDRAFISELNVIKENYPEPFIDDILKEHLGAKWKVESENKIQRDSSIALCTIIGGIIGFILGDKLSYIFDSFLVIYIATALGSLIGAKIGGAISGK